MASLGEILYRAATVWKRLVGNITVDKKFLSQTGTGSASAAPSWERVNDVDVDFTDNTTNNVSIAKHGYTPKLPNDSTKFLNGVGGYSVPPGTGGGYTDGDAQNAVGGILTDTATIDLTYNSGTPSITADVKNNSITEAMQNLADNTTNNASTAKHGYLKKLDNNPAHFMDGQGNWSAPSTTGATLADSSATHTTAPLADDATENFTLSVSKRVMFLTFETDFECWIRVYATSSDRANDASRLIDTDPDAGVGVFVDILTDGINPLTCSPPLLAFNNDGPPSNDLYFAATNKSGGSAAIQIDTTYLVMQ
jgi:hypothetical protein